MNTVSPLILLVEDQTDLRLNLTVFLQLEGFRVLDAAEGEAAFGLAKEHLPEVIISDVAMPGWDGKRLLDELQREPATRHIPVVFLSAWADRDNREEGCRLGAAKYITKPFRLDEISDTLRMLLATGPAT